ncbi:MAG TPA: 1,4-dihydroxy-2-naphthoate polyprenyltransferase [Thermoanaerobaculia bacterium]
MGTELPAPGSLGAWVLASRPPTLVAAFVPVAVGAAVAVAAAVAAGGLRAGPTLAALAGALWIQIGTNFDNDVFDYEKGADTGERLGPTRAVQAGLLDTRQMRLGMWVAFALAGLCGVYLTWAAGWPIVAIGVVSVLAGIAYTGGPFPLGYNGLGDVFVFVFFGFVAVCGTAYANLRAVPELAWWAAVAPGALATNILVVNNVRDRLTDAAGKRTLAVRFAGVAEYVAMALAAYGVPVALWLRGLAGPWALAPLVTLPLAAALTAQLVRREGRPLNATLVGTARLLVAFGVLFAAGLAVPSP